MESKSLPWTAFTKTKTRRMLASIVCKLKKLVCPSWFYLCLYIHQNVCQQELTHVSADRSPDRNSTKSYISAIAIDATSDSEYTAPIYTVWMCLLSLFCVLFKLIKRNGFLCCVSKTFYVVLSLYLLQSCNYIKRHSIYEIWIMGTISLIADSVSKKMLLVPFCLALSLYVWSKSCDTYDVTPESITSFYSGWRHLPSVATELLCLQNAKIKIIDMFCNILIKRKIHTFRALNPIFFSDCRFSKRRVKGVDIKIKWTHVLKWWEICEGQR